MHRRTFFPALAAAAMPAAALPAANAATPLLKPKALRPGDTVGLITPATYVSDPDSLQLARQTVEFLGLKPKFAAGVGKRAGYLGGSIEERVRDLHAMFADPDVKAIFCIRGGYGAAMLLDRLDYALIARNPKIFVGYSDITALHLGIHRHANLVTFHGPVTLSSFPDYTLDLFKRALFEARPLGRLTNPPEPGRIRPAHRTRTLHPGKATGPIVGGNLSLISSTLGTPYEIQTEGKVLFLEDVDEQPYSMDRMLTHLRLAGKFKGIRGLILGECADCAPRDFKPSFQSTFSLGEVYDNILGDLKVPMVSGLTIGHTSDQMTLPLGIRATLDATEASLTLEESATLE